VITLFKKPSNEQQIVQQPMDASEVMAAKPDADIQFSFYTNLATMQVSAPQVSPSQMAVENKIKPMLVDKPIEKVNTNQTVISPTVSPTKAVDDRYLLQIAAFKNPTAAGEMRISLLLAGFEVEIVKAMHDGQLLYQLQQGPFSTVAEAKAMQRELKKKDIESVIVKKIT
jgi:cell division protein FtsN